MGILRPLSRRTSNKRVLRFFCVYMRARVKRTKPEGGRGWKEGETAKLTKLTGEILNNEYEIKQKQIKNTFEWFRAALFVLTAAKKPLKVNFQYFLPSVTTTLRGKSFKRQKLSKSFIGIGKDKDKTSSRHPLSVGLGSPPAFPFRRQKPIAFSRSRNDRENGRGSER